MTNEMLVNTQHRTSISVRFAISNPTTILNTGSGLLHNAQDELSEYGLVRRGVSVIPIRVDLRKHWQKVVAEVLADGETRFFTIHQCSGLVVLALSTNHHRLDVQIHIPRKSVCSRAAIDQLAKLVKVTPRERDVLECIADGLSTQDIARSLGTRLSTVRTQIKSLLSKLDQNGTRRLIHFLARLPDV